MRLGRRAEDSRRRTTRSRILASSLALVTLGASRAAAQTAAPVAVDYAGHAGCPSADRFWSSVAARTSHARRAPPRDAVLSFRVLIERRSAQSVGRVVIESRDGGREERLARDASCEQVADALAVIVALAVDSNASPEESTTPAQDAPRARPTQPVVSSRPPVESPLAAAEAPRASPAVAPPPPRAAGLEGLFGFEALGEGGTSADLSWGGALFAQLDAAAGWRSSMRASFVYARGAPMPLVTGEVQTDLVSGALDECPARLAIGRSLLLGLCGREELGVVTATGQQLPQHRSASAPWFALGGVTRLEWAPVDWWRFEMQGGAVVTLDRHAIVVSPPRTVLDELPAVGAVVALGGAVRFL
jgi:hypothetical protein